MTSAVRRVLQRNQYLRCDPIAFPSSGDGSWINVAGSTWDYYYDGDSVMCRDTDPNEQAVLQAIVDSDSSETVTFWWKVSCEWYEDFFRFYIDDTLQQDGSITGETEWAEKTYTVSSGIHTLKWVYEDGGGNYGENSGWVDFVQWTGPSPAPDPNNWNQIEYKYDVYGRRSEKKVDGFSTRYVYDGAHVIAEYDGNNNLLRKYMYGPGIDQPVCMIEVADSNATYYYHYDALGSVIALSDSTGDTVQTYEYSVFGEPAVEDPNHTNPFMFAGRRFDIEIGLYYNRARYYNPYVGRFLQTDPIGYDDEINWYAYCGNNPLNFVDPSGNRLKTVKIPLDTVWHEPSSQQYVDQARAENPDADPHKADVDDYLREAGFYDLHPDARLVSVSYSYSKSEYTCVFDVQDDILDMYRVEINGVPVLNVKTRNGNTPMIDKRLHDKIGNSIEEVTVPKRSRKFWAVGWPGMLGGASMSAGIGIVWVAGVSSVWNPIGWGMIIGGAVTVVVDAGYTFIAPRRSVPNFAEIEDAMRRAKEMDPDAYIL